MEWGEQDIVIYENHRRVITAHDEALIKIALNRKLEDSAGDLCALPIIN